MRQRERTLSTGDRDTGLCRQKRVSHVREEKAERPAENAGRTSRWISEGLRSETDPAEFGKKKRPAGVFDSGGFVDWTVSRIRSLASALGACAKPAGRFHRGATRGELGVTVADDSDRYPG